MKSKLFLPILICSLFFIAYTLLSLIKHAHFLSGYDLAIADQIVWKYSQFKSPVTTVQTFAFTSLLEDHIEIIYILLAPFYWLWNSVNMLLLLQTLAICTSGLAVYFFARKKELNIFVSSVLLISYLSFYGIQFAIWSDVHSLVFGVSFLAWFLYALETNHTKLTYIFFLLAIFCKEDIALLTLAISIILFFIHKRKISLILIFLSVIYLSAVFFVYFPHFTRDGYRYAAHNGLFNDIDIRYFLDSKEKQQVWLYSFAWFGFIPLFAPVYLLIAIADLGHYFVLGHAVVSSAQGLFLHYRSSLALFLVWPTIIVLANQKRLMNFAAVYLFICICILQFVMHLPLSYLAKKWFWTTPASVNSIQQILGKLPPDASVVTQVNILPHVSHRNEVFLMWPGTKDFKQNSPCGKNNCLWFHWFGHPKYMIVDTSNDWDERYWLINKSDFVGGLINLEKAGVIKKIASINSTTMYKVLQK